MKRKSHYYLHSTINLSIIYNLQHGIMSFINTCLIKVFVTPAGDEGYRTSEPELIHSFIIFFVSIIVLLLLGCCGKFGMIVMYHVIVEGLTSKLWSEKGERLTDNKFHNCLVTLYHGVSKIDLFIFYKV